MADRVQFILDKMAPLFKEMEKLEIFTTDEIKSIVKQRTDFEYLLRRRQLTPRDYYKYLKFELNLDELRSIRCYSLNQAITSKDIQQQFHKVQSSFLKHICYIFDRGLRRFPNSVDLWNDYISFLQDKKAYNTLTTVYAKLLNLFPTNIQNWLQASMFELSTNSNAHAARVLLQRGLRFNPKSSQLWLRYFELELWYSLRNNERRNYLGLPQKGEENGGEPTEEENDNDDPSLGIPWIVYQHAVTAMTKNELPEDVTKNQQFCLSLLSSCESISTSLHQRIYFDIEKRYGRTTHYWMNLFHQYVHSTSFEEPENPLFDDPDVVKLLGKRDRLDEVEENHLNEMKTPKVSKNHIDSISKYLENCYHILCDYQKSQQQSTSVESNKNEIYGTFLVEAFRRVMNQMSLYSYEFLINHEKNNTNTPPVTAQDTTTTNKSKKRRKNAPAITPSAADLVELNQQPEHTTQTSRQESIQRLSQILDNFRVLLISVYNSVTPPSTSSTSSSSSKSKSQLKATDYHFQSDLLITQHELYRCLTFLSQISHDSHISFDQLPDVSNLIDWLTTTITTRISTISSNYRESSTIAWKIIELIWNSARSSFASVDISQTMNSNQQLEQIQLKSIENIKSAVFCVVKNLNLLLVAQDTIYKKNKHLIDLERLINELITFLQNPSPLLSDCQFPSNRAGSRNGDSKEDVEGDDEVEDETDEEDYISPLSTNQYFPSIIMIFKQIISSPICHPTSRINWCLHFLRFSSLSNQNNDEKESESEAGKGFSQTIQWIENTFHQLPQSLSGGDFTAYYDEVIAMEFNHLSLLFSKTQPIPSNKFFLLEKLINTAQQRCGSVISKEENLKFQNLLSQIERMKGNHKMANHILWRNQHLE